MKSFAKFLSAALLSLTVVTTQAGDEDTQITNGSNDVYNPFSWFSVPNSGMNMAPDAAIMEFHPMKPDSWARMVSPQSHVKWHMAMMNPANYAQYMQPAFYMEFMNPNNWMAWMNPASYQVFMDPRTITWWMNPASYMHAIDPNMYAQLWNVNSYAQLMAPENYMPWMNPATYANFMNPETYLAYTESQSSEQASNITEQTTEGDTPAQ